jgi:hypothetical protein
MSSELLVSRMATAREKNLLGEFMDFNSLLAAGARVRPGAP